MVEKLINYVMFATGRTWRIGGEDVLPDENDIMLTLDRAAKELIDSDTGQILEVGGLLIEKKNLGHAVYIYVGDYL